MAYAAQTYPYVFFYEWGEGVDPRPMVFSAHDWAHVPACRRLMGPFQMTYLERTQLDHELNDLSLFLEELLRGRSYPGDD